MTTAKTPTAEERARLRQHLAKYGKLTVGEVLDALDAADARIAALESEVISSDEEGAVRGHERQRYLCGVADGAGGGYAPCAEREKLRARIAALEKVAAYTELGASHVLAKIARDLGMNTMAAPEHVYMAVKRAVEQAKAADALSKSMGGGQ